MTVNFRGYVFNDAGSAINGATVALLETGTTTQEASTTTDSNGLWYFTESDQDRYDIKISSGSSVRYIRWDDQISLKEIDVRNNTGNTTPAATFTNITNNAANQVAVFSGANSTRADNDEIYLSFKLADSAGNLDEFARITAVATDVTSGTEDGQIEFDVIKAGTLTKVWTITSSASAAMSFDMNVDALTIGSGADTDVSLTFDANSADGVITWMEDEDYFQFSDDILMSTTERINLRDDAIYIYSSADGQLDLVADTEIQIAATTIDINGAVALNGAITGATNITLSGELDAATLDISGNADIDGTTNLDAVDIDGAVQLDATFTVGVDDTGYDVKFFGATASAYMLWDASADDLVFAGAAGIDLAGDIDVDGTANLDAVDIDGAVQIDNTVTVGVDDTGYDVKFFGATASAYMLWDASADDLIIAGGAAISIDATTDASNTTSGSFHTDGGAGIAKKLYVGTDLDVDGTANLDVVDIDGNVQIDGTVTVGVDDTGKDVKFFGATSGAYLLWDESADKLLTAGNTFVDIVKDKLMIGSTAVTTTAAELNVLDAVTAGTVTGSLGVVVDSNKDIGTFRNITLSGELDAGSLDVSGNVDIDGTLETDALTIDGTAIVAQASLTAVGGVEIATTAEINTSDDALRVMTPDLFAASNYGIRYVALPVGTPATALTAADNKAYFHVPAGMNGMDLVEAHAEVATAPGGAVLIIDIYNATDSASMLDGGNDRLTIDAGETGSDSANDPVVIATGADDIATNDVIRVDVKQIGSTGGQPGAGLVVTLGFRIP